MRQVDADTAISLIQKDKIEGQPLNIIKALGDGLQAETLNMACDRHIKIINSLPTIEAEPKHGRWINDNGLYKCSVCNEFTITGWANCIPIEQMNKTMKYCNNCGARMDGREDD